MVRAPRIFSRRRVWLNRCHSFARVSDCEKGEDEANGGRNDCQRAPVNEPIGPVIKGETTVRPRGNVDQRNQTALRKDGKVAPIDLRAIAWKNGRETAIKAGRSPSGATTDALTQFRPATISVIFAIEFFPEKFTERTIGIGWPRR